MCKITIVNSDSFFLISSLVKQTQGKSKSRLSKKNHDSALWSFPRPRSSGVKDYARVFILLHWYLVIYIYIYQFLILASIYIYIYMCICVEYLNIKYQKFKILYMYILQSKKEKKRKEICMFKKNVNMTSINKL